MACKKKSVAFIVCCVLGLLFLVAGVVLIHVFAQMIHSEVDDNVPLVNGSDSYKNWQKPTTPIYFQVWMFDVVNREEVMQGEKPVVVQLGPYTYREYREKFDIQYYNNGTVFYREKRSFNFDRERSVGSESDTFHTLNLPMLTVAWMVRYQPALLRDVVQAALDLTQERLFIKLSVKQLMWGYDDEFMHEANKLIKRFHINMTLLPEVFGLFEGQNGTDDGLYQIYSGIDGVSNFGEIISWNGIETLPYWTTDIANAINGSDGTLYPPFFNKEETKYMFSTDICRSIGMDYIGPVTERGIDMYRYEANSMMFANVSTNPYNAGFCTPANDCLPSGLLNVSVCREGSPVVMSMPHFLDSAPEVINNITGMHPNKEAHSSYIEVETMTGVVMNAGKKLQINAYLEKIDNLSDFEHFKFGFYMPVMWLNESALISESDASDFRSAVTDMVKLTEAIQYCLIALGGFILVLLLAIFIKAKFSVCSKPPKEKVINASDDDDEPLLTNHNTNTHGSPNGNHVPRG